MYPLKDGAESKVGRKFFFILQGDCCRKRKPRGVFILSIVFQEGYCSFSLLHLFQSLSIYAVLGMANFSFR